ncbi:hypothetical protein V8C26DRAFT_389334 [Trichoderma gracile]
MLYFFLLVYCVLTLCVFVLLWGCICLANCYPPEVASHAKIPPVSSRSRGCPSIKPVPQLSRLARTGRNEVLTSYALVSKAALCIVGMRECVRWRFDVQKMQKGV